MASPFFDVNSSVTPESRIVYDKFKEVLQFENQKDNRQSGKGTG